MKPVLVALALTLAPVGIGPAHADHECRDRECADGSDYSQDYSGRDRNRNRGRNRGAFSPGPFDRSPVDAFNGNTICLPGSTCYSDGRRDQPQEEER